ncbi:MAG: hypothetical protein J6M66_09200 [Lachnospiraceae bacterium]|nr:hypothetical protein [Lachnospiraceae bacterium]
MANGVFHCDVPRGILRKIDGNEKALYLEISDEMISGKGIIYLESSQREYSGDISNYEIKSIKKIEKSVYEGLDALIIYVRVASLYGAQKLQVRLPGLKNLNEAMDMLNDLIMAANPAAAPAPTPVAPAPAAPAAPAADPAPAAPVVPPATPVAPTPVAPAPVAPTPVAPAPVAPTPVAPTPVAPTPVAPTPVVPTPVAPTPVAPTPTAPAQASVISVEEYKKKLEKLEAIYQTGMITEKEYKSTKAEYISVLNGLDSFFNKVKVNLQYSEVGFLSAAEFDEFKKSTIAECSDLVTVSNDVLRQNLKKLLILYLFEILTDDEYSTICSDITRSVQYSSSDTEEMTVDKINKWPILKECEIISEAQYEQFIRQVSDDTKIRMNESLPVLEHKLMRLTTISQTFLFTPEEFAVKKQELVNEMTTIDYSSEAKIKSQISCIVTLQRCGWINDAEFQAKKNEIVQTMEAEEDIVSRLQKLGSLTTIGFLSEAEYKGFEQKVIDDIFQPYSDISELQKKAQNLMKLKDAAIIGDEEFNGYKKKLLSLS